MDVISLKGMLHRRPNLMSIIDIFNSELKNEMTRITLLSIMKVTRIILCITLLYRYHTRTFAQIFVIVQFIVLLFISLVSFKIINSWSHNVLLHY